MSDAPALFMVVVGVGFCVLAPFFAYLDMPTAIASLVIGVGAVVAGVVMIAADIRRGRRRG